MTNKALSQIEDYDIPKNYNWEKSTNDNYCNADATEFVGDFVKFRRSVDYDYHVNYTPARQLWQDKVIKSVVVKTEPQAQPWIVYTCGPMGAGAVFVGRSIAVESIDFKLGMEL